MICSSCQDTQLINSLETSHLGSKLGVFVRSWFYPGNLVKGKLQSVLFAQTLLGAGDQTSQFPM